MRRLAIFMVMAAALCGCSFYAPCVPGPHPVLTVPNGFEGEIFLVADKEHGVVWSSAPLVVPDTGILRVANLKDLAAIRPDAFDAQYASGKRIQNRNRGGDWEGVGLWPVSVTGGDTETIAIYLVVGTFHARTVFENFRMNRWKETLEEVRAGKRPNQPLEPTRSARGSS